MRRIIEQLKRQREEAKDRFIDNSLLNRMLTGPTGINTNQDCWDLDVIRELNSAISCLENATATKEDGKGEGEEEERTATEEDYIQFSGPSPFNSPVG